MSYLDLLREEFPETPTPEALQKLQKAHSDNPWELQKVQEAPFYSFYSSPSRGFPEIKPAVAAEAIPDTPKHKLPLSPELELLVRKAATPVRPTNWNSCSKRLVTIPKLRSPAFALEFDASIPDPVTEARRQRVLSMLEQNPAIRYAMTADAESDPEEVIVTLAIRDFAECELRIPKRKYDPFLLLKLIEQHGGTVH